MLDPSPHVYYNTCFAMMRVYKYLHSISAFHRELRISARHVDV